MLEAPPLYARVIGDGWSHVADPIRALHGGRPILRARGRFRVERGRGLLARALAHLLRLPRPGSATAVNLEVTARAGQETWVRTFDDRRLHTRQYESREADLAERFGLLEFRYEVRAFEGGLVYAQRETAVRFGPVRLRVPDTFAPRVEAREGAAGPRDIAVHVRVALPGAGPLIAYDGTITVEDGTQS